MEKKQWSERKGIFCQASQCNYDINVPHQTLCRVRTRMSVAGCLDWGNWLTSFLLFWPGKSAYVPGTQWQTVEGENRNLSSMSLRSLTLSKAWTVWVELRRLGVWIRRIMRCVWSDQSEDALGVSVGGLANREGGSDLSGGNEDGSDQSRW